MIKPIDKMSNKNSIGFTDIINSLYFGILKREPDEAVGHYVEMLKKREISLAQLVAFFSSLDEAYERAAPQNLANAISLLYANGDIHRRGNPFLWRKKSKLLVFFHFPKTGGLSLVQMLSKYFHPLQIVDYRYPDSSEFAILYSGHYEWRDYKAIKGAKTTISCLRDPHDRLRSLYFFLGGIVPTEDSKHLKASAQAKKSDFEGFFCSEDPDVINQVNNCYVRHLSGFHATHKGDPLLNNPDRAVSIAFERLSKFEMVYFLEEVVSGHGQLPVRLISGLEKYFGDVTDFKLPWINQTVGGGVDIPRRYLEMNSEFDCLLCEKIAKELGVSDKVRLRS